MIIQNKIPKHYCEVSYLELIENELVKEFDDNYSLYLIHLDLDQIEGKILEEKIKSDNNYKIAIHVGNESHYDPKYYEFFDIIFRFYLTERCDFNKIFPINIGFNSSGEYNIHPNKGKKLSEEHLTVEVV